MRSYAKGTEVSVDKSRLETEELLKKYGADQIVHGWESGANPSPDSVIIGFRISGRQVKIALPLPLPTLDDPKIIRDGSGRRRTEAGRKLAYEQECRERWRALALAVKAKLTSIAAGITTVEREFLADIVLPDGSTFGQWAGPQLDRAYLSGQMPPLLPGLGRHPIDEEALRS